MALWRMHALHLQTLEMGCTRWRQVVHGRRGEMASWVRTEESRQ